MAHVYCLRDPGLIALHATADAVIAFSYFLIPAALLMLIRSRRDLAFPWMFALFGIFILGCGATHVLAIVTLWTPIYRFDGILKALTAIASLGTAVLLFRLLPQLMQIPSPEQLRVEINERKRAEREVRELNSLLEGKVAERTRELRHSEERFRQIADLVPDFLWSAELDGNATFISQRFQQYAGIGDQRFAFPDWQRIVHPSDWEDLDKHFSGPSGASQSFDMEVRLRRVDGVYRWFMLRTRLTHDDLGEVNYRLGSCSDIDQIKRTEQALRRSNEELEQFAYAAAHDLQEPLRNVSLSLGMLRKQFGVRATPDEGAWIDKSIKGAHRMQTMVTDLLQYSRVVSDNESDDGPIDTKVAAERALRNLEAAVRETAARIEIGVLPKLPVRESHLVTLFQNLIGNAIKYRKPGTQPLIQVSAAASGGSWQFAVADNGIGFDPAYSDRIFKVFKRLHNRDEYSGNGIGLALCARIVAHYGGRIWADAQPGRGATFHFTV